MQLTNESWPVRAERAYTTADYFLFTYIQPLKVKHISLSNHLIKGAYTNTNGFKTTVLLLSL